MSEPQMNSLGDGEFLRVSGLHAFYGESHILHGIDFAVNRGELITL
ncbi:MAG: ABC transporter ATP-binding protein, partial [Burkholderiales bacterium]